MMMYLRTPSCMPCAKNDGESRVLEICTHGSTRAAGLTPAATLLDGFVFLQHQRQNLQQQWLADLFLIA
jgi:hypothetical protein